MLKMKLTIFTPTYNRAVFLKRLCESLSIQTCKDFEWIVVDDGSTDDTKQTVSSLRQEMSSFSIRYYYQENAGKMMAQNRAVKEAKGELFMCLDSDDYLCSEKVVEDCLKFWENYKYNCNDIEDDICGFITYKRFEKVVESFPEGVKVCHLYELYNKGFHGETCLILRKDLMSQYPYPYFKGEKFITDAFVFDQIDQKYRILLFPYAMQQCRYHEDGYSNHYMELLFANPLGYRAYHEQCVKFRKKGYLKSAICYIALSMRILDGKMIPDTINKALAAILFPLGVLKYFYDNYRLKRVKYAR